jgi:CysZ protein
MKSLLSALGMTLALLTSWIPALNFLSAALAFLLMTFQYVSYAQTRRGHGLIESLKWILLHPASCMSFGAVLTLLFSIPLISVFAIPVAVVGGTLLFAQTQNPTNAVPR